jgi:MFS family permease
MISFQRYAELFRAPGFGATYAASVVGRLPIGIATLGILLFLRERSGSFSAAGTAAACYVAGLAMVAPALGRMMDRMGPRPVLAISAMIYPLALAALIALVFQSAAQGWVLAAAALAGAAFPPLTVCMRAMYPRLVPDPALLHTAYSVDSALVETVFVVGPVIVAGFVALGSPAGAVLFAAACAAAGTAIFLRSPGVRGWTRLEKEHGSLLGPLRDAPLRAVLGANLFYAVAFGLYEMAVIAHAAGHDRPAAAGLVLALASVGSAAGVLFYGARHWNAPVARQFLVAVGCMTTGLLVIAPLDSLWLFALANVIAGAPMAPVIAVQSLLVSRLTPRGMMAESFTWSTTGLLGGISAGIAAGGVMAEYTTPGVILLTAAASTLLAGLIVWLTVRD